MTKKEKELLLADLCARLPYGIECTTKLTCYNDVYTVQGVYEDNVFIDCPVYEEGDDMWMVESIIPYLRPMSSMTNQEIETYRALIGSLLENSVTDNVATLYNFLNSKHLDYRGMIHMGLALEAPEGMYDIKTE